MFALLKPKYIKTIQDTPLRGCSWDDCSNFAQTRDTLVALGIKGIPKNNLYCIEKILCPFKNMTEWTYVTLLCIMNFQQGNVSNVNAKIVVCVGLNLLFTHAK